MIMMMVIYDDNDKDTKGDDGSGHMMKYDDDIDIIFVRRNIVLRMYRVIVYHFLSR